MLGVVRAACRRGVAGFSHAAGAQGSNSRWLDDMEKQLQALRDAELKFKDAARVGKKLKRIGTGRLEMLAGAQGFAGDAVDRGVRDVPVAWGDQDGMVGSPVLNIVMEGHVNNVHYNRWAEMGRVAWISSFGRSCGPEHAAQWHELLTPKSRGLILASITTSFKMPVTFPDRVSVIHRLASEVDHASTRFFLEGLVFSHAHQRIAAQTWEELVVYDYPGAKKAPLLPFMVEAFAGAWEAQEKRRGAVEVEVKDVWALVDGLKAYLEPRQRKREAAERRAAKEKEREEKEKEKDDGEA